MINIEKSLNFHKCHVMRIDLILRKYSYSYKLNKNQLEDAAEELDLRLQSSSRYQGITEFYETVSYLRGYDLKVLLLLGVFLGVGDPSEKALVLFQIYDMHSSHSLDIHDFVEMMNKVADLLSEKMEVLVNTVKYPRITGYLHRCSTVRESLIDKIAQELYQEACYVKMGTFIEFFSTPPYEKFLSSSGLRVLLFKEVGDKSRKIGKTHREICE